MSRAQGGSLLVAGFETWPATPVGTYTIASENFGLGDPTALTRAIEQVSLDGERITGRRHANRLLKLLIVIRAATRQALDLASGQLEAATNQDTWQVQWTPPRLASEAALPVIYEAYRAVTTIEYDVETLDPSYVLGDDFVRAIYVEAPAFPFGRNPTPISIAGSSSLLILDDFEYAVTNAYQLGWRQSSPGPTLDIGYWVSDSTVHTQGTKSWRADESGAASGTSGGVTLSLQRVARPFSGGPANLTGYQTIAFDARLANIPTGLTWAVLLHDGAGQTATAFAPMTVNDQFVTVSLPLSSFTGVDLSNIVSWQLFSSGWFKPDGAPAPIAYLDNLRAIPNRADALAVTNGGTYRFAGVPGTARANVALDATPATAQTFGALLVHRAPAEARQDYTPIVPLSATTAPPYTVNLPNYNGSNVGQRWDGTHAVWLGGVTTSGTGSRTITVTFTQVGIGTVVTSRTFAPADVVNGMLFAGIVTLPFREVPDGSTFVPPGSILWTVTIGDTNTADRYADLMVLDVRGPTVVMFDGFASGETLIDIPLATAGVGRIYVGGAGTLVTPDNYLISGGPCTFEPGDNIVVFYSPQGAPTVGATFYPRWLSTRNA